MPYIEKIAVEKARQINSTPTIYGTFAEIGGGLEVVNHFFKAGLASQTVAKSMSAYDMTFSDEIYGKAARYVSEKRLLRMLDHEYGLLKKRLQKKIPNTRFFAFADTVTTNTESGSPRGGSGNPRGGSGSPRGGSHGWMGIRFQLKAGDKHYSEMILHTELLDRTRLQQCEALGVLGVNLIFSAFFGKRDYRNIIKSLFDNLEMTRVSVDSLRCNGKAFKNISPWDLNKELVRQGLSRALLAGGNFEFKDFKPMEVLYEKPVLVLDIDEAHDSFKELTSYVKKSLSHIKKLNKTRPIVLFNVPLKQSLRVHGLQKTVSTLSKIAETYLLLNDFNTMYDLRIFLRKTTRQNIHFFLNRERWESLLFEHAKNNLSFLGKLFDKHTFILLAKSKGGGIKDGRPNAHLPLRHLKSYLKEEQKIHLLD